MTRVNTRWNTFSSFTFVNSFSRLKARKIFIQIKSELGKYYPILHFILRGCHGYFPKQTKITVFIKKHFPTCTINYTKCLLFWWWQYFITWLIVQIAYYKGYNDTWKLHARKETISKSRNHKYDSKEELQTLFLFKMLFKGSNMTQPSCFYDILEKVELFIRRMEVGD